ncbi:MAG: 50S ribosomal protein L13 [Nanoarchaeota archaeon]
MTKIIDGKNAVMGRLASYAAKEALKGEEVVILNCQDVIITGNRENILKNFQEQRGKVGWGQTGPKHIKASDRMVKRVIRGMVPNYREGRGREAYRRIKCYTGVPKEFENAKKITGGKEKKIKFSRVGEFVK